MLVRYSDEYQVIRPCALITALDGQSSPEGGNRHSISGRIRP
jgi:hypothetical protein